MAVATKLVMTRKSLGVTEPLPSMQKVQTVFSAQQADMRRMTASSSYPHRLCSWCSAILSVSCLALRRCTAAVKSPSEMHPVSWRACGPLHVCCACRRQHACILRTGIQRGRIMWA